MNSFFSWSWANQNEKTMGKAKKTKKINERSEFMS